jgi:small subunit ribosomal protein S16
MHYIENFTVPVKGGCAPWIGYVKKMVIPMCKRLRGVAVPAPGVWMRTGGLELMPVKIRLARGGRKKRPFYRIVVASSEAPRDGRFIENIGTYDPLPVNTNVHIDSERLQYWLGQGAKPTDTVRSLIRKHAKLS